MGNSAVPDDNHSAGDATVRRQINPTGQVRVRSNVALVKDAWHLVPGDVLKRYGMHHEVPINSKQHEEMMYYTPCSICRRLEYQFMEEGCDYRVCRDHGKIPSMAEAARRQDHYPKEAGTGY